jgi:hypothetical protein
MHPPDYQRRGRTTAKNVADKQPGEAIARKNAARTSNPIGIGGLRLNFNIRTIADMALSQNIAIIP